MTEPQWLTDDQQRVWRKLAALMTLLPAALDAQLQRDAQLTHFGYWTLAMLSEAPDHKLRMSELAARGSSSQSRISHAVAKLEERGWVRRDPCPEDRRGFVAVLTDAGYAKLVATAPGHVDTVRHLVVDALTDAQLDDLERACDAMLDRFETDPSSDVAAAPRPVARA
jgi:DNA-binding MarR family transcriptional regulator